MLLYKLNIPLEQKLRALIAGMRYAASKAEEESEQALERTSKHTARARASTMRADADALEALINDHSEATRAR